MTKANRARLALSALLFGLAGSVAAAMPSAASAAEAAGSKSDERLVSSCASKPSDLDEEFVCHLRATGGGRIEDVDVAIEDASSVEFETRPYSWVTNKSAFYFVVQRSSVRSDQILRMTEFLDRAAYPKGRRVVGLATAGETLIEEAVIGSTRRKLDSETRNLRGKAPGDGPSAILGSIEEAIDTVRRENAERRAVVLLTDADPSTSGYNEGRVISKADRSGVVLYVVSFGEDGAAPADTLKRLGRKTDGGTFDVSGMDDAALKAFAERFPDYLDNGEIVTIPARGLPAKSRIVVSGDVAGPQGKTRRLKAPQVEVKRATDDPFHVKAQLFLMNNLFAVLAIWGLVLGGALVLVSGIGVPGWGSGRAEMAGLAEAPASAPVFGGSDAGSGAGGLEDATRIFVPDRGNGDAGGPRAYLEVEGGGTAPVALGTGTYRIGRSADNDIRLTNPSIHRAHAVLQLIDPGGASIHDLDTRNGVYVNGRRCTKSPVYDGDLIELGEVKLRFKAVSG